MRRLTGASPVHRHSACLACPRRSEFYSASRSATLTNGKVQVPRLFPWNWPGSIRREGGFTSKWIGFANTGRHFVTGPSETATLRDEPVIWVTRCGGQAFETINHRKFGVPWLSLDVGKDETGT